MYDSDMVQDAVANGKLELSIQYYSSESHFFSIIRLNNTLKGDGLAAHFSEMQSSA